jgi:hypothetical protein
MSPPEYPLPRGGGTGWGAGGGEGLSSAAPPISRSQGGCHNAGGKGEGREEVATSCRLVAAVLPTPASKSARHFLRHQVGKTWDFPVET